jgi:hypothetical protein
VILYVDDRGASVIRTGWILVLFTAPVRCHECRAARPEFVRWASDPVKTFRRAAIVDVESPLSISLRDWFGKNGVPRYILFENGLVKKSHVGPMKVEEIASWSGW